MPPLETLLTFTLFSLLLNLSPGPSNFYVMALSISQGVKGGIVAAMGLSTGLLVHVLGTAFGVSAVFQYYPMLYIAMKVLGATYLFYLGMTFLRTQKAEKDSVRKSPSKTQVQIFKESIMVEIANPSTALFFLALLPQFVLPQEGTVMAQIILLGTIVILSALPCDILVALTSSKMAALLSANTKAISIQERVSGILLILMGAFIVIKELVM